MSYQAIKDKIATGEVVLMDGGTGSEIERQGVKMNDLAWCGMAHMEQPAVVRQVHESYIRAGADIIIANTYGTAPHVVKRLGLEERTAEINQSAVRLALQARDAVGAEVCVAASMSSMPAFDSPRIPVGERFRDGYFQQAELLAEAGAELIIAEMMMDVDNATMVTAAARACGLPLWIGFSASMDENNALTNYIGLQRAHDLDFKIMPFKDMAARVLPSGCDGAGVMHTWVNHLGPALAELRELWQGPAFAYAESGHFVPPSWKFEDVISPEDYLDYARQWIEQGAQIIGGCCGIGPDHIRALRENLSKGV